MVKERKNAEKRKKLLLKIGFDKNLVELSAPFWKKIIQFFFDAKKLMLCQNEKKKLFKKLLFSKETLLLKKTLLPTSNQAFDETDL